eukprot:1137363-Pelagomonas_calceolata.AAC.1
MTKSKAGKDVSIGAMKLCAQWNPTLADNKEQLLTNLALLGYLHAPTPLLPPWWEKTCTRYQALLHGGRQHIKSDNTPWTLWMQTN